jgi:hypothetical protein
MSSQTSSLSSLTKQVPTIVLTNNENIEKLNQMVKEELKHDIVFENDFDLYTMLKDMTKVKTDDDERKKRKIDYKGTSKLLTAKLSDIIYTDGKLKLNLTQNETFLYSKKINCIGTNLKDFAFSEIVSLDLQALSTRVKLMCKLIIIIQGACLERFGPPKLVQDRCIQFDGDVDLKPKQNDIENPKRPVIKSASCENLLLDDDKKTSSTDGISIEIIYQADNNRKQKKRKESTPQIFKKQSISEVNTDDEEKKEFKTKIISQKKYDLENYYRHRMSKYSLKDYASVPYYQYSGRNVIKQDTANNTEDSYLKSSVLKRDQSTCTNDLLNNSIIGYYSKMQLLSNRSLHGEQSSLLSTFSETQAGQYKSEFYYSYTKKYFIMPNILIDTSIPTQSATHLSGITIQTTGVSGKKSSKSSKWGIFNKTTKEKESKRSISTTQRTSSADSPRNSKISSSTISRTVKF